MSGTYDTFDKLINVISVVSDQQEKFLLSKIIKQVIIDSRNNPDCSFDCIAEKTLTTLKLKQ